MKLRFATVCASNQNRSMEAHAAMKAAGFLVESYGAGYAVKLPGPSIKEPNVYKFGTSYKFMFDDLTQKDPELYKKNGLLRMLKRNMQVKEAPQKWQDNAADGPYDVIITFEERVFDIVNEDMVAREQRLGQCALVINLEVRDTHEEAASGAKLAVELCHMVESCKSWEDDIDNVVHAFEREHRQKLIYNVIFY